MMQKLFQQQVQSDGDNKFPTEALNKFSSCAYCIVIKDDQKDTLEMLKNLFEPEKNDERFQVSANYMLVE